MSNENKQITLEQIQEAVKNNTELEASLVGYAMQTASGKNVLNNHKKNLLDGIKSEEDIAREVSAKAYNNVEESLKEFGVEKLPNEKTSDYVKRVIKSKSTSKNEDTQAEIEAIKKAAQAQIVEKDKTIESLRKEYQDQVVLSSMNSVKIDFDDNVPQAATAVLLDVEKQKLLANRKVSEDGKVVFLDSEGKPITNNLLEPATAQEILQSRFKEMGLLKKEQQPGGGAKENATTSSVKDGVLVFDTSRVETKKQFLNAFNKACLAQGIAKQSDEYNKNWAKAKESFGNYDSLPKS